MIYISVSNKLKKKKSMIFFFFFQFIFCNVTFILKEIKEKEFENLDKGVYSNHNLDYYFFSCSYKCHEDSQS